MTYALAWSGVLTPSSDESACEESVAPGGGGSVGRSKHGAGKPHDAHRSLHGDIEEVAGRLAREHGDGALDFALRQACAAILAGDAPRDRHWTRVAEVIERQAARKRPEIDWRTRPPAWLHTGIKPRLRRPPMP